MKNEAKEWRYRGLDPQIWVLKLLASSKNRRGISPRQMQTRVPHPIPGLVGHVLLPSALGCSILIDFSILGYFCQLEFIEFHSSV